MVRKRERWTRTFGKRRRPKTPAPKTGWVLAELARLTGLTVTTVRYYVHRRILRPSEFRGTNTRYQRRELLRLLGLMRLKVEGKWSLNEMTQRLDSLGDAELERWLQTWPLPPAAAAALGIDVPSAPTSAALTPAHASAPAHASTPSSPVEKGFAAGELWQRIALLPGLELLLRADAKEAARSAAQRICEEYVVR